MRPLFSDIVVAAFITGSLALASVILPIYLKNRRSMRKVSAEEFIENFMKRQEQEIAHKNQLILEMEGTLKKHENTIRDLEKTVYKKDTVVRQLKALAKELRVELKNTKAHSTRLKLQLEQMKEDYKNMTGKELKDG